MSQIDTTKINNTQKIIYQNAEKGRLDVYDNLYANVIEEMSHKKYLAILDIGGGAGFFARWIKEKIWKERKNILQIKITVIDSVRYDVWDIEDECIEYIQCDAVSVDSVLENESYDYIFCNMFVHHLVGKNFQESDKIRRKVFNNLYKVLKNNGKLLIADNVNNGFLFDESSSRILFTVTTCRNLHVKKILFSLGAHSAGVGVCMLSQRMWERLLKETGFVIEEMRLTEPRPWKIIKKILLMNREYRERVLFVTGKSSADKSKEV